MNFWKKGYTNVPGFVPSGYGASEWAESKNKPRSEEEYFEKGDSDEEPDSKKGRVGGGEEEEEEEDDPLEAFMMGIEQEVNTQKASKAKGTTKTTKGIRDDIEQEDDQESYFKAVANTIIVGDDADDEWDYDDEGNPIPPERSKVIDPLPPIDHSTIDYPSFEKNFYEEHSDVVQLQGARLMELRHTLGLKVSGPSPLKPCVSFAYFGFDEHLMGAIRKSEFTQPTPIQAQAIPCVLAGRDVIGIAKTGSGKTAAYLWPMLVHIMDQPELTAEDGPIGLICAPTRELCQQIYHEARKFGKVYGLRSCAVYGGVSKWEQVKALKDGAEILVATPGRLIDLVKAKATNLQRVTYLVFDEADRMFDMGFEPQVRSIANHVRPDRQTLLFSATFRKKVERLCRDTLVDPLRVVVGELGEANTDVTQHVFVFPETEDKWGWLATRLVQFTSTGSVLIFVTRKLDSEVIVERLRTRDTPAGLLHGDMDQGERDKVILGFKKGSFPVLVATDVAARGLDIPSIRTVINYDVAKNIDTHIHRIGRTGRAGEKGTAYTLVTAKDVSFAGDLVRSLEAADQEVPDSLLSLAMQSSRFRKSRYKSQSKGKGERRSFKPRQRPGLGMSELASSGGHGPSSTSAHASGSGSGSTNRAQFLREAFTASYKSNFRAASSASLSSTSTLKAVPPPSSFSARAPQTDSTFKLPPPPSNLGGGKTGGGTKRKSRWE